MNSEYDQSLRKLEEQVVEKDTQMTQKVGMLQEQVRQLERQLLEREKDSDLQLLVESKKNIHDPFLDPSLPIAKRLQEALYKVEDDEKLIVKLKSEIEKLNKTAEGLMRQVEVERANTAKKVSADASTKVFSYSVVIDPLQEVQLSEAQLKLEKNFSDRTKHFSGQDDELEANRAGIIFSSGK